MPTKSADAFRHGHALLGWTESVQNGYLFTHDFFSPNIRDWTRWFEIYITQSPIRALEIGSWQGGSATWLLDKIVAPRGGNLTCIDTFEGSSEHTKWISTIGDKLENLFDHNIMATGHNSLCRKMIGKSQDKLKELKGETFDFIYIDGAHEAKYVIQDAILSWDLLETRGFLLFDDIDFHFEKFPEQDTIHAINAFTSWFNLELDIVDQGRQMLIQKR